MRYLVYSEPERMHYPICLLVPEIKRDEMNAAYIAPFELDPNDFLVMDLHQVGKKTPMAEMRRYIEEELIPIFKDMGTRYILCADAEYFKALTKAPKVEANLGYVMDCAMGPWKVVYVPNYKQIFYDPPKVKAKIQQGMLALKSHMNKSYEKPGTDIIKFEEYPESYDEIKAWLQKLLDMDVPLAIDIEGFSLKHPTCGIGTISFAWSKHEGIAFAVDYVPIPGATEAPFGLNQKNEPVRALLKEFFEILSQRAMYHSISFDVYVLVYQLFMNDLLDRKGMLEGLEVMLRNWDCTKLITFLATNSCAGNRLSLKEQAQEYAGNYAESEIEDITRIPIDKLLRYNLVDALSTWFTHEKHWETLVEDQQEDIYQNIFKPAIVDIIEMQLTGMPINMETVKHVKVQLEAEKETAVDHIMNSSVIKQYTYRLQEQHVAKRNEKLKTKQISMSDQETLDVRFNPNSGPQLQDLLFEHLGLPVVNLTKNKQPSTDGESLEALQNHTTDPLVLDMLQNLMIFKVIEKLTSSFIPALEGAFQAPDGWHYVFGNFNLGGTISGRLSSSEPNLQNLPSTGKGKALNARFAKLIKSCFEAPPGWLFVGIDFSSLEDRISALTTKDPNKLKVYTDGYDGHSLRAYAYWPDDMPDIDPNSVDSINSIAKKYKPKRDRSKNPTFTLTYQGTWVALVKKYGFTKEQALDLEAKYHALYQVSDAWVDAKLDEACKTGYITVAFGLRLRTPLLKQVIRGTSKTPFEAEAEGRTAGNALGQSWCLLNTRAGIEFNQKSRTSKFKYDIRPCAQIHDAQYFIIRDDIDAIMFTNEHLVKAVEWQDHPEIYHDDVKLGGELSIFYPNWTKEIVIPNGATEEAIFQIIKDSTQP